MRKFLKWALVVFIILIVVDNIKKEKEPEAPAYPAEEISDPTGGTNVIMGAAFTPRNFPGSSMDDVQDYFEKADVLGNDVILITEWEQGIDMRNVKTVRDMAHAKGMRFHLHISPIALNVGRNKPAIPDSVTGKSFGDQTVRDTYKAYVLAFAKDIRPDVLGLGTEVNYLARNEEEYTAFVSLIEEVYQAVKVQDPAQVVTISFQWDQLQKQDIPKILGDFEKSLDVYSFTTYPSFSFDEPSEIPDDYYTKIRTYLPNARIGFSEIGWHTKAKNGEVKQNQYYGNLKTLMGSVDPEFALLGLLHDVKVFGGALSDLNSVGVRNYDGSPKESWNTIVSLGF